MSDDLISRRTLFNSLFVYNGKVCPNRDIDNFPINFNVEDIKKAIISAPTAYDVDKVMNMLKEKAEHAENKAAEYDEQGNASMMDIWDAEAKSYRNAIEIVKSGGIADE